MAAISTSGGQSTGTGQGTSESHGRSYIPDYPQAPLLQAIAQYAFDQAPQVYDWGMTQFNKNQDNIDGLMRDALSYASPQRISVDMGMAEAGVQQAAEKGRLSAVRDLESYGIDPSSGRYAALDEANRVMASASAAGAGNQQRMADEAAGNAMRNQAISASLQNTQVGYEAAKAQNALLATGSQLKYPPLGNISDTTSQHTQESQSTQESKSQTWDAPRGGGGGGGSKPPPPEKEPAGPPGFDPNYGRGTARPQGGVGGVGGGAGRAPAAPKTPAEREEQPPPPPPEGPEGPSWPVRDPEGVVTGVPEDQVTPYGSDPSGKLYGTEPAGGWSWDDPRTFTGTTYDPNDPTTQDLSSQPPDASIPITEGNPLGGGNPLAGLDPETGLPWQVAGGDWRAPIGDQGGVTDQDVTGTGEGQGIDYQLPSSPTGQVEYDPAQFDAAFPGLYDIPTTNLGLADYQGPPVPAEMWGTGEWEGFDTGGPASDYWTDEYGTKSYGEQYQGGDYGFDPNQDVSGTGAETAGGYDFSGQDFTGVGDYAGQYDPSQYDNWGDTGQYDQSGDQSQYDFGDASDYYDSSQYDTGGWDDQSNWDTGDYGDTGGDNWDISSWDDQSNWDTGGDNWDTSGWDNYDYGDYSGGDTGGDTSGDYGGDNTDYSQYDNTDYGDGEYARGGPVRRRQLMPMRARGPMRRPRPGGRPRPPMRPPMRLPTGYSPGPRLPFGPRSGGPMVRPEPRPQPPNISRMAAGGPMRRPQPAPNITQMAAGGPPTMPRGGYLQANGMPQSQAGIMPSPQRMQRGGPAQQTRGPNPQQATQGGFVSRELSPSGGSQTDDVNAQLNAGEFVIPKDVAKWKGREFFYKLIQQARKQGQGGGQPPTTGYGGQRQ